LHNLAIFLCINASKQAVFVIYRRQMTSLKIGQIEAKRRAKI